MSELYPAIQALILDFLQWKELQVILRDASTKEADVVWLFETLPRTGQLRYWFCNGAVLETCSRKGWVDVLKRIASESGDRLRLNTLFIYNHILVPSCAAGQLAVLQFAHSTFPKAIPKAGSRREAILVNAAYSTRRTPFEAIGNQLLIYMVESMRMDLAQHFVQNRAPPLYWHECVPMFRQLVIFLLLFLVCWRFGCFGG